MNETPPKGDKTGWNWHVLAAIAMIFVVNLLEIWAIIVILRP